MTTPQQRNEKLGKAIAALLTQGAKAVGAAVATQQVIAGQRAVAELSDAEHEEAYYADLPVYVKDWR